MTAHEFELTHDITLEATPEQVWDAIATGPGIDSWFMGRNEVEPREGGTASMTMFGGTSGATITGWEPGRRFAYRGTPGEDGAYMAFEYLIEGRDGGSTALRLVHSGILTGDWESEYDALKKGNPLYLRSLAQYLEHFPGRTAVPVTVFGGQLPDQETVWAKLTTAVGLAKDVGEGDKVHFTLGGERVDGVVDTVLEPSFLGVRTDDALLRFVGRGGVIVTGHHVFADVDPAEAEQAWSEWLAKAMA
ncbi:SRPBCC domain-containing protein [Dactylosporangium fulvum]|uniref:SRPBCC domain-containing protein n=1 Tax=Dactylosporangium fulvum TaxID=53359 RepID=A0ABY5VUV4_9ACTN|nr:SRPBCC domain-containing protein [Dactylosporangium fulvum]UWP80982.1 SRPBCC domain-containing protein [Dactylosporangium fulvum]